MWNRDSLCCLFRQKTIIGVDCSATRLQHLDALIDELHLRNVRSVLGDWNINTNDDDKWEFMSVSGKTLFFCNNINFANDNTQDNRSRYKNVRKCCAPKEYKVQKILIKRFGPFVPLYKQQ